MDRRRWWIATLLFLSTLLNYFDRQILSLVSPVLRVQFSLSASQYSHLFSAFLLGYTSMQLLAGWVVGRLGARMGLMLRHGVVVSSRRCRGDLPDSQPTCDLSLLYGSRRSRKLARGSEDYSRMVFAHQASLRCWLLQRGLVRRCGHCPAGRCEPYASLLMASCVPCLWSSRHSLDTALDEHLSSATHLRCSRGRREGFVVVFPARPTRLGHYARTLLRGFHLVLLHLLAAGLSQSRAVVIAA